MTKTISLLLCLMALMSLQSCQEGLLYERYYELENERWTYEEPINFEMEIPEAGVAYQLRLLLRHRNDYPYSNLWLKFYRTAPSGKQKVQRIEVRLAKASGEWLGDGLGGLINQEPVLLDNWIPEESGTYTFTMEQHMRINNLSPITHVGLRVQESKSAERPD